MNTSYIYYSIGHWAYIVFHLEGTEPFVCPDSILLTFGLPDLSGAMGR